MTRVDEHTTDAQRVLAAVGELAPMIAARAVEIEQDRRVPDDLLAALVASGCFGLFRPASHGGIGADLPAGLRAVEELARADASTGWITMIGSTAWCDLAGLPRPGFDQLFTAGSNAIVAGAFNPTGSIEAADDGYRVSGRWSFASGCEHATWIYGNCIEGVIDGVPHLRLAVFSPDQIVIEDTWRVMGLSGTGSHHFHVDDVVVPANLTCVPMSDEPCVDADIVRIPIPALISLGIAAVAVGVAEGALDDIVALASEKVPLLDHATLATNTSFQIDVARAEVELGAARALLHETASSMWATAAAGSSFTLRDRARARAAAIGIVEGAAAVVDTAFRSGGATSVFSDCALQRRFRDMHALMQHFLLRRDTLVTAGAIFAGLEPDVIVF